MAPVVPCEWLGEQIDKYAGNPNTKDTGEKPVYDLYARVLEAILKNICKEIAPLAIIQVRPKSIESFAEKAARRYPKYMDPVHQLTDLCGGRVIAHTQGQVRDIREAIRLRMMIAEEDDVSSRLGTKEFGYHSIHYLVQLKPESMEGVGLPEDVLRVFPDRSAVLARIGSRIAEVQVRTLLEHAWSDISHDRMYKTAIRIPPEWEHEAHRQAALLENVDADFSRMVADLDENLTHYDAYMNEEVIKNEIATLRSVLEHYTIAGQRRTMSLRIARFARSLRDWGLVIGLLAQHAERVSVPSSLEDRQALLEYANALCEQHASTPNSPEFIKGQKLLEILVDRQTLGGGPGGGAPIKRDSVRADALAALGRSCERQHKSEQEIRTLFRAATTCDPGNPYHLASTLRYEIIWHRDLSFLRSLAPQIEAALNTCRRHGAAGIALPQAFTAMGAFHAYLGDYYSSLESYAKAGALSPDGSYLRAECESVGQMVAAVEPAKLPVEWAWLLQFLKIVSELKQPSAAPTTTAGPLHERFKSPVVIVAGGADPRFGERFAGYEPLLLSAFEGFHGTVVCGGTRTGIPGIMGTISDTLKQRPRGRGYRLIAYRPQTLADDAPLDERYDEHIKTSGHRFSPLEPIRCWADLLSAGVDPRSVCVLGINGGDITAAEYHLGLAMGATVGIIEDSGRKASELLSATEDWPKSRLIQLPADPMTLQAFVLSRSPAQPELTMEQIERGGQVVHDAYEQKARERLEKTPWERVREEFKASSREQVAFAPTILAACGFELAALGSAGTLDEFTPKALDCMAEKEHGRWCIERLLAGWRYGPSKDVDKKISPYLVSWKDLPAFVQAFDLDAVRAWPGVFQAMGFAIRWRGGASPSCRQDCFGGG